MPSYQPSYWDPSLRYPERLTRLVGEMFTYDYRPGPVRVSSSLAAAQQVRFPRTLELVCFMLVKTYTLVRVSKKVFLARNL